MVGCLFNVANGLHCVTKCPDFSEKSSKCQLVGLVSEGVNPNKSWIQGIPK